MRMLNHCDTTVAKQLPMQQVAHPKADVSLPAVGQLLLGGVVFYSSITYLHFDALSIVLHDD